MLVRRWLHAPQRLTILVLGIMALLVGMLGWLGWRLLLQDRALADQQIRMRLERAADAASIHLRAAIKEQDEVLSRFVAMPQEARSRAMRESGAALEHGALYVGLQRDSITAFPSNRLMFYPSTKLAEATPRIFAAGEALEFRAGDAKGAIAEYASLAESRNENIRAGALLRIARVSRKTGRIREALDLYDTLGQVESASIGGVPAPLVARFARLSILRDLRQTERLGKEATALGTDLRNGRWRISRATHEFYMRQLKELQPPLAPAHMSDGLDITLAEAVEQLWEGWQDGRLEPANAGYKVLSARDPALLMWRASDRALVALVASDGFLKRAWLDSFAGAFGDAGITVSLTAAQGTLPYARPAIDAMHQVTLSGADAGLPWTLRVMATHPSAMLAQLQERRRLAGAGLVLLLFLVGLAAYSMSRAVARELAVARLQSEFVAAVSHEFRTPLTSLRQLAELLSSGRIATDGRRAEYYAVIERETQRLQRLVEALLDFGRMEAGVFEFKQEMVDLPAMVAKVVDDFRAEQRVAQPIILEWCGDAMTVRGDREALGLALWNLLDNAAKYSAESAPIYVSVATNGDGAAIVVRDKGVGMAPTEQLRVFEKFVRGDASRVLNVKGTGIGLAMVRRIVRAHGGNVLVESAPGEGSSFAIHLRKTAAS